MKYLLTTFFFSLLFNLYLFMFTGGMLRCMCKATLIFVNESAPAWWELFCLKFNIIFIINTLIIFITSVIHILGNFGKYAISHCRFITCQNFQFWQVCSSDGLLKILASMFIWWFVCLLLAKIFQFWQVCSSDGLSVCLSVCLSGLRLLAGYRSHRLTNHHQTWTKCVSWSSLETHVLSRSKVK